MDWGDACSVGRNCEQYFLLLVDKNTEYCVTSNKTTRDSPVDLLQEYMNFTGKPIRFLRVDNEKEFTRPAMVDLCNANNIILQVVVSYNHLMQARVEGAMGICKQHTRVALAVAHAPARFWPAALTDFRHKRNFLWSSKGTKGKMNVSHQLSRGTFCKVAVPFGCRVTITLPK